MITYGTTRQNCVFRTSGPQCMASGCASSARRCTRCHARYRSVPRLFCNTLRRVPGERVPVDLFLFGGKMDFEGAALNTTIKVGRVLVCRLGGLREAAPGLPQTPEGHSSMPCRTAVGFLPFPRPSRLQRGLRGGRCAARHSSSTIVEAVCARPSMARMAPTRR